MVSVENSNSFKTSGQTKANKICEKQRTMNFQSNVFFNTSPPQNSATNSKTETTSQLQSTTNSFKHCKNSKTDTTSQNQIMFEIQKQAYMPDVW